MTNKEGWGPAVSTRQGTGVGAGDIDDTQKVLEALRASEEKYRTVVENSDQLILVVQDNMIKYANPRARRGGEGYTLSELASKPFIEFIHPDDRKMITEQHEGSLAGDYPPRDQTFRVIGKKGEIVWVHNRVVPISWEGRPARLVLLTDITEQRLAAEKMKESERRYRELADLLPQTVFETDLTGRLTFVNHAAYEMFGYTVKDFEGGLNVIDMVVSEERESVIENFSSVLRGKTSILERTLTKKSGTPFPVAIYAAPVVRAGQPAGLRGFVVDMTEQKRSQDALTLSEGRLRAVIDSAKDSIFMKDANLRYMVVNKAMGDLFRRDPGDIVGKTDFDLFGEDTARHIEEVDRQVLSGITVEEEPVKTVSGEEHIFHTVKVPLYNEKGQVVGLCGIARDITDRKHADDLLRASEAKYRAIFDNTGTATLIVEEDGTISLANAELVRLTGYSRDEMEGKKKWTDFIHPDDLSKMRDYREIRRIDPELAPRTYEFRLITRKGDVRDISITVAGIPGTGGVTASLIDITDRRRAEEEKERLENQLLHAQKMEAIGQLAGGVAHDFNNILTTIIGYGNLLQMKMDRSDPLSIYVDQVLASAQRAAQLTHSLLAFSRKQVIELEPRNVNSVVKGVENLLKRLLTEDIEFRTVLADQEMTILADMTQIEQVLINLATNARDAMPEGGALTIQTESMEMTDEFRRIKGFGKPGRYALVTVSDTGTGMGEKTKAKIFEPFFTTKEVGRGTGLGLSIVYGIVKQHNGYIDVRSTPKAGTVFYLYLPLVKFSAKESLQVTNHIRGGSELILVAEDSIEVRHLTREVLETRGYGVIEAIDGEDALAKFVAHRDRIDIVLLDVVMPKRNGREVYEAIQKIKPGTKVLFISGYTADIVTGKGIQDNLLDYVSKPLSPMALLTKIREILDRDGETAQKS
jgi:two-component system cell cycle sensor histidine kinase/response regulator CckA